MCGKWEEKFVEEVAKISVTLIVAYLSVEQNLSKDWEAAIVIAKCG